MSIADKLTTIADNQQKVYDTGYEKGNQTGYDAGEAKGKEDLLDSFWENYQDKGKRTYYNGAFSYMTDEVFNPKYDIKPTQARYLFMFSRMTGSLPDRLKELGITMDLSADPSVMETFSNTGWTNIGEIYMPKATSGYGTFAFSNKLKVIEKLTFSDSFAWSSTFAGTKLQRLIMGSKITKNGFDVQWSTELSKESIISIINALSDTTTALTVTLSKTAVNNAFETAKGNADGSTSEEWAALIATKQNWTISLV